MRDNCDESRDHGPVQVTTHKEREQTNNQFFFGTARRQTGYDSEETACREIQMEC